MIYFEKTKDLQNMLKCIDHPMRQDIMTLLDTAPSLSVTDIYSKLNLDQSSASQQLKALLREGLIVYRKDGTRRMYRINRRRVKQITDFFENLTVV